MGAALAGKLSEADLNAMERCAVPTVGSCPGQFTANTMAMVAETLGFALPGVSTMPAVYSEREASARLSGSTVMKSSNRAHPCLAISSRARAWRMHAPSSPRRAAPRTQCCTSPRSPHEAGVRFDVDDVSAVMSRVPLIADMKPGGRFLAKDLHAVGGLRVVLRQLLEAGHLHGDTPHVAGRDLASIAAAALPADATSCVVTARRWRRQGVGRAEGKSLSGRPLVKVAGCGSRVSPARRRSMKAKKRARNAETAGDTAWEWW